MQYWKNYIKGTRHALDDGATSPNAISGLLIASQPYEPVARPSLVDDGLVEKQTIPERGAYEPGEVNDSLVNVNWAGQDRILYDDNSVMMATPEGAPHVDNRDNRRRMAWQALLGAGHFESMHEHDGMQPNPTSSAS